MVKKVVKALGSIKPYLEKAVAFAKDHPYVPALVGFITILFVLLRFLLRRRKAKAILESRIAEQDVVARRTQSFVAAAAEMPSLQPPPKIDDLPSAPPVPEDPPIEPSPPPADEAPSEEAADEAAPVTSPGERVPFSQILKKFKRIQDEIWFGQRAVLEDFENLLDMKAVEEAETSLADDPENTTLLDWLAFMYYTNDFVDKAIDCYKKLIRLKPESPAFYFYLGNCFYKTNLLPEAIYCWDRVAGLNPPRKMASRTEKSIENAHNLVAQWSKYGIEIPIGDPFVKSMADDAEGRASAESSARRALPPGEDGPTPEEGLPADLQDIISRATPDTEDLAEETPPPDPEASTLLQVFQAASSGDEAPSDEGVSPQANADPETAEDELLRLFPPVAGTAPVATEPDESQEPPEPEIIAEAPADEVSPDDWETLRAKFADTTPEGAPPVGDFPLPAETWSLTAAEPISDPGLPGDTIAIGAVGPPPEASPSADGSSRDLGSEDSSSLGEGQADSELAKLALLDTPGPEQPAADVASETPGEWVAADLMPASPTDVDDEDRSLTERLLEAAEEAGLTREPTPAETPSESPSEESTTDYPFAEVPGMEAAQAEPATEEAPVEPPTEEAAEEYPFAEIPGMEATPTEPGAEEAPVGTPTEETAGDYPFLEMPGLEAVEAPTEEPTADEPTVEAPTEEPTADEPTVEAPTEEPAADEPPVEVPTEEPAADEPPVEVPTEEPAADEPPAEAPTEEPATDEPPVEVPTEEPAADEPPAEAPTEEPAEDEPPAEAPTEEPAADEPPVEAPTEEPAEDEPPVEASTETPVTDWTQTDAATVEPAPSPLLDEPLAELPPIETHDDMAKLTDGIQSSEALLAVGAVGAVGIATTAILADDTPPPPQESPLHDVQPDGDPPIPKIRRVRGLTFESGESDALQEAFVDLFQTEHPVEEEAPPLPPARHRLPKELVWTQAELAELLRHDEPSVRLWAARRLVETYPQEAEPLVLSLLKSDEESLRIEAIRYVGLRELHGNAPQVARILEAGSKPLALAAIEALGRLGYREAIGRFTARLEKFGDHDELVAVVDALGRMGSNAATKELQAMLHGMIDPPTVALAIQAILEAGEAEDLDYLVHKYLILDTTEAENNEVFDAFVRHGKVASILDTLLANPAPLDNIRELFNTARAYFDVPTLGSRTLINSLQDACERVDWKRFIEILFEESFGFLEDTYPELQNDDSTDKLAQILSGRLLRLIAFLASFKNHGEQMHSHKHAPALRVKELAFILSCYLEIVVAIPYEKHLRNKVQNAKGCIEVLGLDRDDIEDALINLPLDEELFAGLLGSLPRETGRFAFLRKLQLLGAHYSTDEIAASVLEQVGSAHEPVRDACETFLRETKKLPLDLVEAALDEEPDLRAALLRVVRHHPVQATVDLLVRIAKPLVEAAPDEFYRTATVLGAPDFVSLASRLAETTPSETLEKMRVFLRILHGLPAVVAPPPSRQEAARDVEVALVSVASPSAAEEENETDDDGQVGFLDQGSHMLGMGTTAPVSYSFQMFVGSDASTDTPPTDTPSRPEPEQEKDRSEQDSGDGEPSGQKVSRNAPCPCGSGKKFKKCCGKRRRD